MMMQQLCIVYGNYTADPEGLYERKNCQRRDFSRVDHRSGFCGVISTVAYVPFLQSDRIYGAHGCTLQKFIRKKEYIRPQMVFRTRSDRCSGLPADSSLLFCYVLGSDDPRDPCITDHSFADRARGTFGHFNETFVFCIFFSGKIKCCPEHAVS